MLVTNGHVLASSSYIHIVAASDNNYPGVDAHELVQTVVALHSVACTVAQLLAGVRAWHDERPLDGTADGTKKGSWYHRSYAWPHGLDNPWCSRRAGRWGMFHCFDETTVVAAGDAVSTAGRAADMGVLIEVVGVSVPVCGFHLDRCWYSRFHTGNDKRRRGRRSSQRGFWSRFIRNNRERCGGCGGSMPDGSLVLRDERLLRCTETMILVVSITINSRLGSTQQLYPQKT